MAIKSSDLLRRWAKAKTKFIVSRNDLLGAVAGQTGGNYDVILRGDWLDLWPAGKRLIMHHTEGNKIFQPNTQEDDIIHRALTHCHDNFADLGREFRTAKSHDKDDLLDLTGLTVQEIARLKSLKSSRRQSTRPAARG